MLQEITLLDRRHKEAQFGDRQFIKFYTTSPQKFGRLSCHLIRKKFLVLDSEKELE